jgi:hypothetical protein
MFDHWLCLLTLGAGDTGDDSGVSFDIENDLAFEPGQFDIVASVVVCRSDTTDLVELDGTTTRLH